MEEAKTEETNITPPSQTAEVKVTEEKPEEKKEISALDEAKFIMEETKKYLAVLTEERKRIEKANANMMIAGKGFSSPEKPKEETPAEYAKRIMQGNA